MVVSYVEADAGKKAAAAERTQKINIRVAYYLRKGMSDIEAKARAIEEVNRQEAEGGAAPIATKPAQAPRSAKPIEARRQRGPKSSRYKGVSHDKGIWRAVWTEDGRVKSGHRFDTEIAAARDRDRIIVEKFGYTAVRAKLNFPEMFGPSGEPVRETEPSPAPIPPSPRGRPRTILLPLPEATPVEPAETPESIAAAQKRLAARAQHEAIKDASSPALTWLVYRKGTNETVCYLLAPDLRAAQTVLKFGTPGPTFDLGLREIGSLEFATHCQGTPTHTEWVASVIDRIAQRRTAAPEAPAPTPHTSSPKPEPTPRTTPADDPIHSPSHYQVAGFEAIDVIEAMGWGPGFTLGNALKYIMRAGKKAGEPEIKDLAKARWYLDRRIEALAKEGQTNG